MATNPHPLHSRIKLVIFDLDGTLVDAYRAITASFNFTMRQLGYPALSPLRIRRAVGWGDKKLISPFVSALDFPRALRLYRSHHRQALLKQVRLMKGARPLLAYLSQKGYLCAIASNRPTRYCRIILRRLRIESYFKYVLCGDRLRHMKPHPQILQVTMRRCKVLPVQTVYVGDMTIDMETGSRAGVTTIGVIGGSSTRKELKQYAPFTILGRIDRLRRFL